MSVPALPTGPTPTVPGAWRARRLLFVSSVTTGGSGRSQRELAATLLAAGREVRFLVDAGDGAVLRRRVLGELADVTARLDGRPAGRAIDRARRRVGARPRVRTIDGLPHEVTVAPENAAPALLRRWRPDVVVVSSIDRGTWRAVRRTCRRFGIPTALHLREAPAVGHLSAGLVPDLLLAHSGSLVDDAARLGYRARLVPSVVRVDPMDLPPSGAVALLVNPLPSHGVDLVGPLASARVDIPIVLQESWPLGSRDRQEVERLVRAHSNVTFRAYEPRPRTIFRDARLVLAPHRVDNRPRTVHEAQANGLPVVASDHPGLREAVGDGGVLVPADAGVDAWVRAVADVWDDADRHMTLSERARIHANRPEVRPEAVADRFGALVDELVGGVGGDPGADQDSSMSPSAKRN